MTTNGMKNQNYNAHHSPIGAFASFTLGFPGAQGGLGLELGGPANQNVYIGVDDGERTFRLFPFFTDAEASQEASRYDVEQSIFSGAVPGLYVGKSENETSPSPATLQAWDQDALTREFNLATDTWAAPDFSFTIYSPARGVPDPQSAAEDELKSVLLPAVLCELTVDNSQSTHARRAVFGYSGNDPLWGMRRLDDVSKGAFVGVGEGNHLAIACRDEGVTSGLGFAAADVLSETLPDNYAFALGKCALLLCDVPAGEKRTFRFAVCFHRSGIATSGLRMQYYYNRFFPDIESVASYALDNFDSLKNAALQDNALVEDAPLSDDQKWMFCHAVRSYYGSTELLEYEGKPVWAVNEGEYRMLNTFDLTVDHLFWELRMNPWAVKNQLDWFVDRYSYEDKVHFPGDRTEYSGGISFTHDMGMMNAWSRPGYSSYEKKGLDGVFSHMTQEQLANWLCCATAYVEQTGDREWLGQRWPIFEKCFQSLLNRDHPDPARRRGLMQLDSSRCGIGSEITTYDSLDVSLGQARNNVYLAVKIWASYLALEKLFRERGDTERAQTANQQAHRTASTLLESVGADGTIPAVLEGGNQSRIIPIIEGLIFPYFTGRKDVLNPDGEFSEMLAALRRHLEAVLKPGLCLFEDGGWKLSSTSDNSWLSKIYLCQFVARHILGHERDEIDTLADAAHVAWLLDERNAYFAWSDQMLAGFAEGSKYYPRGVTSALWLLEG
jgi:hypothetical protein